MQRSNDDYLQEKVEEALKASALLNTADINFEISNGYLSLWGMVDVLAEKRAVENILRKITGINQINNNLTVAMDRAISDEELAEIVTEKMAADPRINLHNIGVIVENGVVNVVGNAESLDEAKVALLTAEGVYGVKEVSSQAKIKQKNMDDATLTNLVETELSRSLRVSVRDIETETKNGIVKLKGKVDTPDQVEAALQTVYRIKGVREVQNELLSRHPMSEGDASLTNEIRNILGENGLSSIKAYVVNGILFLDGKVYNVDQKHRVEELVTKITGITGINNAIVIAAH